LTGLGFHDVPPPSAKTSEAGAGSVNVDYRIGTGRHTIYVSSIHTDVQYQQECSINIVWVAGDGEETEMTLESGVVSNNRPFSLAATRHVEGPGFIRATVVNLESDKTFTFKINYIEGWFGD